MTELKRARHEKFDASTTARLEARAISETEVIRLSIEDQRQVAKALLNPPKPNPALKRAFQRRRQLLGA
jgi:uncharacterized protein (DUF1778 family)